MSSRHTKIVGVALILATVVPGAALAAPDKDTWSEINSHFQEIQAKLHTIKIKMDWSGTATSTKHEDPGSATSTKDHDNGSGLTGIENAMEHIREALEQANDHSKNPSGLTNALNRLKCISIKRNLFRGLHGDDVRELQLTLISQGHLDADNDTGFFGPKTEKALGKWQLAHGIVLSASSTSSGFGFVGPRTRAALTNCGTTTPPVVPPNDTTAPTISGLSVTNVGSTTATVSWITNEAATGKIYHSTTSPVNLSTALTVGTTATSTSHTFTLTSLSASTTYYFVLESKDAANNTATTSEQNFVTIN